LKCTQFAILSFLCVLRAVQFRIYGVVFDIIDAKPIGLHPTNTPHQLGPSHRAKHYPSSQCYGPTSSDRGSQRQTQPAQQTIEWLPSESLTSSPALENQCRGACELKFKRSVKESESTQSK
jgi:hypothetical protein